MLSFVDDGEGGRHTLVTNAVPKSSETHDLSIFSLGIVGNLFLATILLQPFIKPLRYHNASLALFHGVPHPSIRHQRVVSSVDCLHDGTVIWVSFGPEWNEPCNWVSVMAFWISLVLQIGTPFHHLKLVFDLFRAFSWS